jgi:hypothetical protein
MLAAGVAGPGDVPPLEQLPRGGIVGQARVVDMVPKRALFYPPGADRRWHMPEQNGFVLEGAKPLPFVACRGEVMLFYRVSEEIRESVRAAIAGQGASR